MQSPLSTSGLCNSEVSYYTQLLCPTPPLPSHLHPLLSPPVSPPPPLIFLPPISGLRPFSQSPDIFAVRPLCDWGPPLYHLAVPGTLPFFSTEKLYPFLVEYSKKEVMNYITLSSCIYRPIVSMCSPLILLSDQNANSFT